MNNPGVKNRATTAPSLILIHVASLSGIIFEATTYLLLVRSTLSGVPLLLAKCGHSTWLISQVRSAFDEAHMCGFCTRKLLQLREMQPQEERKQSPRRFC